MELMQSGIIPSLSDVAQAAHVSRATAYRCFPTQAALVQAAVDEALGPILRWTPDAPEGSRRVADLFAFAYPRMQAYEATHRAALLMALDQWTRRQAGTLGNEAPIVRGNRKALLKAATAPFREGMSEATLERLTQSLSLIFGIESIVVLRDIWRLNPEETSRLALWAANALVQAAVAESRTPADVDAGTRKRKRSPPLAREIGATQEA